MGSSRSDSPGLASTNLVLLHLSPEKRPLRLGGMDLEEVLGASEAGMLSCFLTAFCGQRRFCGGGSTNVGGRTSPQGSCMCYICTFECLLALYWVLGVGIHEVFGLGVCQVSEGQVGEPRTSLKLIPRRGAGCEGEHR